MTRRLSAIGATVALALLAPAAARADDPAAAEQLFEEAKTLMKQGQVAAACPKLEESLRLSPGMGARFKLGDCYERLGRTASAWATFLSVASAAHVAGQTEREREARERAQKLERRLARIAVVVPEASRARTLEVRRDNEVVGEPQWGTTVPVDPGPHTVIASAPDKAPYQAQIVLSGDGSTVTVTIPPLADVPKAATEPHAAVSPPAPACPRCETTPVVSPPPPARNGSTTLGWTLVGAGGAAIVGGIVAWVLRESRASSLSAECGAGGHACPPNAANDIADGRAYTAVGITLFGVGAVTAAAGVGVLVFGGKDRGSPSARIVPLTTAGSRGIGVAGTF